MSPKQWWKLLEENWESILVLCNEFLPMDDHQDQDGEPSEMTVRDQIVMYHERRNRLLSRFLSEALWRIPDTDAFRQKPGYDALSKLCEDEPDSW